MLYTSPEFFLLFAVTWLAFRLAPGYRTRFWILLLSSLAFYLWSGLFDFVVYLFVVAVSYLAVYLAARFPRARRPLIYSGVLVLTLHLFVWKYLPWTSHLAGGTLELPLPVGISFFTLQGIAYLVDFLRGEAELMSFREYLLFKSFFSQLIAGPITRARELLPQLRELAPPSAAEVQQGLALFALGLFKKLILADPMAVFVETVYSNPTRFDRATLLMGTLAFYIQLWADFSGYIDMGRGCARMVGIRLPENFLSSLLATGPSDWTQRWHATLMHWMRDYLYRPLNYQLGRLRLLPRPARMMGSLAVSCLAVGLWHGASSNFLAYGLWVAFLLFSDFGIRRAFRGIRSGHAQLPELRAAGRSGALGGPKRLEPALPVLSWALMFAATLAAATSFRAPGLHALGAYYRTFLLGAGSDAVSLLPFAKALYWRVALAFAIDGIRYYDLQTRSHPVLERLSRLSLPWRQKFPIAYGAACGLLVAGVIAVSLIIRSTDSVTAFIYFRF